MATKGGSGKSYNVSSNGTITVTKSDGSTHSISPGDKGYAATNKAMQSDTGKSYSSIKNETTSNSSKNSKNSSSTSSSSKNNQNNSSTSSILGTAISAITGIIDSSSSSHSNDSTGYKKAEPKTKVVGGTGKEYKVASDGTIKVIKNGKTTTYNKGQSGYDAAKQAMINDTGLTYDTIKSVSNNSSNNTNNNKPIVTYTSKDGTTYHYSGTYTEGKVNVPIGAVKDTTNGKTMWKTEEGGIYVLYNNGTTRVTYPGEPGYAITQACFAAISDKGNNVTTVIQQQKLTQAELALLKDKGIVEVYDEKGNLVKLSNDQPLRDGAFYNSETGEIYNSIYTGSGIYDTIKDYDVTYYRDSDGILHGIFKKKQRPIESNTKHDPTPIPPQTIDKPAFIPFNEPIPTFSSDLQQINKYDYFFGLDYLKIKKSTPYQTSCFVSKTIDVKDVDYLELAAEYYCDDSSSIEFYIIDDTVEYPILPINDHKVINEKLFSGLPTRFNVDTEEAIVIKDGSTLTNYTYQDYKNNLIDLTDNQYNITYIPITDKKYVPKSSTIKIKVIIRNYELQSMLPYVSSMSIRQYGKDNLWTMNI